MFNTNDSCKCAAAAMTSLMEYFSKRSWINTIKTIRFFSDDTVNQSDSNLFIENL